MRSKVRKLGYDVDKYGNAVFKDKKGKPHLVSLQTKLPKSLSPAAYDALCNQKYWNNFMDKHPVKGMIGRLIRHKLTGYDAPRKVDKNGAIFLTPKTVKYKKELMEDLVGHEMGHKLKDSYVRKMKREFERTGNIKKYVNPSTKTRVKSESTADKYAVKRGTNPARLHKFLREYSKDMFHKLKPSTYLMKKEKLDKVIRNNEYLYRGHYLEKQAEKWNKKHKEG